MNLRVSKKLEVFPLIAEDILASQGGLCSVDSVSTGIRLGGILSVVIVTIVTDKVVRKLRIRGNGSTGLEEMFWC